MKLKQAIELSKSGALNITKNKTIIYTGEIDLWMLAWSKKSTKFDWDDDLLGVSKWKVYNCNNWVPDDEKYTPKYIPKSQGYKYLYHRYYKLKKEYNGKD